MGEANEVKSDLRGHLTLEVEVEELVFVKYP